MKKNIFIINGHEKRDFSPGELNKTLVDIAVKFFASKGHDVTLTNIDDDFINEVEVEKFVKADFILFQTPMYWMGVPAKFKRYIDDVYMSGYGKMFNDDGRGAGGKYGSGGMLKAKYVLSTTCNAPKIAFEQKDRFGEGLGMDIMFFNFHKAQEFVGLKKLPTFSCFDVIKDPNIEADLKNFDNHLKTIEKLI